MKVWRFHNRRYEPLDTTGASLYGGRWNPRERPVLYTSATFGGGLLELIAHTSHPRMPPVNHVASLLVVPDDSGVVVISPPYPAGWDDPYDYSVGQALAMPWLVDGKALCLDVPSVAGAPVERNLVMNARNPSFQRVMVEDTIDPLYDPRVWRS